MNHERWTTVKQLLDAAIACSTAERASYLERVCGEDVELRKELESLLVSHDEAGTGFLNRPVADLSTLTAAAFAPTREARIGPYEIREEIGRGGMGEVYRAVRADGQYDKEVAIKLVRTGFETSALAERFRLERQILASLDHPNIARLLDGGTTRDGVPYLVMELVAGIPIDQYCDEHRFSLHARLQLFRQVCSAVEYAHQRLVIHRDLKPANIIVTTEGVPKLLDFGIAKLLDPSVASGITMAQPMTLEYASPEQIRGEPLTTATDVYSLGVVLYRVLTGRSPYAVNPKNPAELTRAICELNPTKPSSRVRASQSVPTLRDNPSEDTVKISKSLAGDLDNIALTALKKDPALRYRSVEQFSEDVRRYLEHLPIRARKDSVRYRLSKFISRHRFAVAASSAAVIAILMGLAVAVHEAHIAREQAELARAQRMRAERRFDDVRRLANSLIFEIHDSIRDLPGAMPVRKVLVNRALGYLDNLSHESGGDAALQRELANAYDRLGDVLGYEGAANMGDFKGAMQSYRKAVAIREAAAAASPQDVELQSDLLNNYFRLSFALQGTGDVEEALAELRKGIPVAERLAAQQQDSKYKDWQAGFHWRTGEILARSARYQPALDEYRKAFSIREPLARSAASPSLVRTHLAADYAGQAQMLYRLGDLPHAIELSRKGLRILEEQNAADPNRATLREYLAEAYLLSVPVFLKNGNLAEALTTTLKALKMFQELSAKEPSDWLARVNVGFSELALGDVLTQNGRPSEAIVHLNRGLATFEATAHKTRFDAGGLASAYSSLGSAYMAMAKRSRSAGERITNLQQAQLWLGKSVEAWRADAHNGAPDPFGGFAGDEARRDLAKCESLLVKD